MIGSLIVRHMEQNKKTLREALDGLPTYRAPAGGFEAIRQRVDPEAALHRAVADLPTYEPPPRVWQQIAAQLRAGRRGARVRRLAIRSAVAAAAAVLLLVLIDPFGSGKATELAGTITYSTEVLDAPIDLMAGIDEDQEAYEEILAICTAHPFSCERDHFKALRSELEELNLAHEELRAALDDFGTEPELIAQLSDLERERSGILREMMQAM